MGSGDEAKKHSVPIKLFSASAGASIESLLGMAGANDFVQSGAGATFAVGTEAVLGGRLSRRERWNAETVAKRAIERAAARCVHGQLPRQDDFLSGFPSSFEEAVEGVLLTAQRNYESKKLEYLGNLVAAFAFDTSVDSTTANWCLRTAELLSWAQYVLLALAAENESEHPRASISTGRDRAIDTPAAICAWEDCEDLYARRIIGVDRERQREGAIPPPMGYVPTTSGRLLVRLMELETITSNDRDAIYAALLKGVARST